MSEMRVPSLHTPNHSITLPVVDTQASQTPFRTHKRNASAIPKGLDSAILVSRSRSVGESRSVIVTVLSRATKSPSDESPPPSANTSNPNETNETIESVQTSQQPEEIQSEINRVIGDEKVMKKEVICVEPAIVKKSHMSRSLLESKDLSTISQQIQSKLETTDQNYNSQQDTGLLSPRGVRIGVKRKQRTGNVSF
ncbi:hypothetical protein EIN_061100 [Entamoeba invadens IP1]|uniref:hypothetical protein n=1 Tax=Entamoeba invadens IP1 TaxID=370355 RepID=UPI0002C3F2E3|nr:hypothetical protein EIN_061100 [Entamoeba invadens IP1]ELP93545.1 hypothetical protein EIN_061100 [Entamoeba invadens IP1]|eukprot:XP_004260316.1 hypothetical protein EIN_061100 [Entamoeba invadens IP1]